MQLSVTHHVTLVVSCYNGGVVILSHVRLCSCRRVDVIVVATSLLQHHMSMIVLPMLISFISCLFIAAVLSILVKGLHIQYRVQSCS